MPGSMTVRVAQRGLVTLPKTIRDGYDLQPGDTLTLLDLDGVFVLSPRGSAVDSHADRIVRVLTERGETLESMLRALRDERESG